jgi:hypothetical protein
MWNDSFESVAFGSCALELSSFLLFSFARDLKGKCAIRVISTYFGD